MAAQHGVAELHQLMAAGELTARAIQRRADTGRLHRIHPGVYSLVPAALLGREGLWMAAVLATGCHGALSHRACAALHELRTHGGPRIEVTLPGRSRRRIAGLLAHRSITLTPADLTVVRGIPCTTVDRTLLDLAEVTDRRTVERACDQAEILGLFDLRALEDQLRRNPGRRGAHILAEVLAEHAIGHTPTWSELEERFLALTRAAGLPDPEVNLLVDPRDGEPAIRVDFAWPERRLAVEADGRATHLTAYAFETDRRRDQRLAVAGWRSIRTTWRQITRSASELTRTVLALWQAAA